jgi:ribosomal protein S12 methylthiotransferase accessory factor
LCPNIRLASFVGISPTIGKTEFRSPRHRSQIEIPDIEVFATEILPLLDGTQDKHEVAAAVKGYSPGSIKQLLGHLEQLGFLESVPRAAGTTYPSEQISSQESLRQLLVGCLDKRLGIISYLAIDPPDHSKLNVTWTTTAILNPSKFADRSTSRTSGFGAGFTLIEAMAKAAAEAMELYAASCYSTTDLLYSSRTDLGKDCLDPRELCLYQSKQYQQPLFPYPRFNTRKPIHWTRGQWIDNRKAVWLPALLTYFGVNLSSDEHFAQVTTSGLATGMNIEDAALRGLYELIERDAFMTTWLGRLPAKRLVIDELLDEVARTVIRKLDNSGLQVRCYLLKALLDIPVVLCVGAGDGKNWPGATVGLGAHQNPIVAVRKAILEEALMAPAMRRELLTRRRRIPKRANQVNNALDHALYYLPKSRARAFDFLDSGNISRVSLSDLEIPRIMSLITFVKRLKRVGVRVAIKDLTPELAQANSIRVVRALATKLQPIHFGFDRTRLASPRLRRCIKNGLNPDPHPLA